MNKRLEQKKQTRIKILAVAQNIYQKQGFLNTTTAFIAKEVGIAHGTLFSHFPNKEALILEIMDLVMEDVGSALNEIYQKSESLTDLLDFYLDFIAGKEEFFSVLYKELPFYDDELRRKIVFRESIIRNYFYESVSDLEINFKVEITDAIASLFANIYYYLVYRKVYSPDGSVIEQFKTMIKNNFFVLLGVKNEESM